MTRRRPEPIEEPEKPFGEMTDGEKHAYLTKARRALHDDEVLRGSRPPRSMREVEIWREAQAAKDERAARRATRAEHRQRPSRTEQVGQSDR